MCLQVNYKPGVLEAGSTNTYNIKKNALIRICGKHRRNRKKRKSVTPLSFFFFFFLSHKKYSLVILI